MVCYYVADPIKLFFFTNEKFLRFLLLSLGHFIVNDFFSMSNKTLKQNSKNQKTKKKVL